MANTFVPVFEPITTTLLNTINELAIFSMNHAKALEKEIGSIVGYGELVDITEEVLTRLDINSFRY